MPFETDEKLKGFLDTNQMHREQMCLAVLAIDRRFSDVRPRHPRGGPDGARDMEATFKGSKRVFGAVGFVNQANDSEDHKKKAIKKFNDDLTEALKQDPKPEMFIFFTNVNLTIGEKNDLVTDAKNQGLSDAEVFDRERIRLSLDNPDGLSIRFQYLGIVLSEAEQATFFARWGDDIQGVITDGFGRIQQSLNRIQFLQEMCLYANHFSVVLHLDREYDAEEIGHFRAFVTLQLKGPVNNVFAVVFGATDNSARIEAKSVEDLKKGKPGVGSSMCGGQWEMIIPEDYGEVERAGREVEDDDEPTFPYQPAGSFNSVGMDRVERIVIRYGLDQFIRMRPQLRLEDFDECSFLFFVNESLAGKIRSAVVYANEYKIAEIAAGGFTVDGTPVKYYVPLLFTGDELSDRWVRLRPAELSSAFHVRFSEMTPRRFFEARELHPERRT